MTVLSSPEHPQERAVAAQISASDPAVSAFVAASAGSGKTKLLTDRLLRLMLDGAAPEKIQCLTFTKAAAAEMALRLQTTLAEWVRLDTPALDQALEARGIVPTDAVRAHAKNLFARVLDLPGGMRIGTIHAFCQSVLRRFPLEAAISPHFRLVEDADTAAALAAATESTLARPRDTARLMPVDRLAGVLSVKQFAAIVSALQKQRPKLNAGLRLPTAALGAAIRRALGVTARSEEDLIAGRVFWQDETALQAAVNMIANRATPDKQSKAVEMLAWLGRDAAERAAHWDDWLGRFLLLPDKVSPRGMGSLVNRSLAQAQPGIVTALAAEQTRLLDVEAARRDLRAAEMSEALLALARPLLAEYEAVKTRDAMMDYDDLIGHTAKLLVDPGAAWVLYKLDGGLDHLLLDEVQDTSPAQWEIAGALTAEFFAGAGAQNGKRTVFAVGDRKQSIYSFQGADPEKFDHWRGVLAARVQHADAGWRNVTLDVSFRSTAPVLQLVDAVFADPDTAAGVLEPGVVLKHFAHRAAHAGCVELWPLVAAEANDPPEPWAVARENRAQPSARQRLADGIAAWIARQFTEHAMLESKGRLLAPGDILVLVRRRDIFTTALVRALKARAIPVGGLDLMVLTDQPAVRDLIALGDALLLPEDDLTFAGLLVSPLAGLSHDDLGKLAVGRGGNLFSALRARADENPSWRAAYDFMTTLAARADFVSPHALYSEVLGALGGRARLLARLGAEAEEPIDEFLNATLSYTRLHPPSLQGFLQWLRRSGAKVKREQEEAGSAVRIMTVHAAKGLQAPLVILPDTTGLPPDDDSLFWAVQDGIELPVFIANKDHRGAAGGNLRAQAAQHRAEEHNRQLYVALTRAEDRLVVCGWQGKQALKEACWYRLIERGFARLTPRQMPFDLWDGTLLNHASAQRVPAEETAAASAETPVALPGWLGGAPDWRSAAPPDEPALPQPLAPSRPEGAALGLVPQAASPLAERDVSGARFLRGKLVHALLQHLPSLPAASRAPAALAWLARPGVGRTDTAARALAAEVLAILDHPELCDLFGPESLAEVPLTGVVNGKIIGGLVDRLAVFPDRVLLADYKTNRDPPGDVANTPTLYLRQMAAYRAVLEKIFAGRAVVCALVWTRSARAVILPPALLDAHVPHAWASSA
ncbi:MAG: double-strand break repair helicase AddA [Acetobacteraceae bacterium]|nr:double-strand break repair helicase AddA [Acetobacteraceae bacterium]MSP29127.1 double-strand break repair helicase AddA [Acetobacteraceae bacterium]